MTMNKKLYLKFAKSHRLKMIFGNYIGGASNLHSLISMPIPNRLVRKLVESACYFISIPRFVRILDNSMISGYLLSIFKKYHLESTRMAGDRMIALVYTQEIRKHFFLQLI